MIIVLTGAPGAGKGTQADLLVKDGRFRKVSTGDSLRKHIRDKTEIGNLAAKYMNEGHLVPDDVLFEILKKEIGDASSEPIILDGYPRNVEQAETLTEKLSSNPVVKAIHLEVARDMLAKRLGGRRVCQDCGASYHVDVDPPQAEGQCDKCGGTVIRRTDDSPDKVENRLEVYDTKTRPVLDYYRDQGLFVKVDGAGSTELVHKRILEELEGVLAV